MPALEISDLVVEYSSGGYAVRPIDGLSVRCEPGELVLLLGPSGCGKTTLLSCLGGILTPTEGRIRFGDVTVTDLEGAQLTEYRRHTVGIVFQAFNLVPSLTALENVEVPLRAAKVPRRAAARPRDAAARAGRSRRPDAAPARATCPVASSSGWRSRVRSRSIRRCSSPTSRPRTSTTSRSRRSSACSATSRPASGWS